MGGCDFYDLGIPILELTVHVLLTYRLLNEHLFNIFYYY